MQKIQTISKLAGQASLWTGPAQCQDPSSDKVLHSWISILYPGVSVALEIWNPALFWQAPSGAGAQASILAIQSVSHCQLAPSPFLFMYPNKLTTVFQWLIFSFGSQGARLFICRNLYFKIWAAFEFKVFLIYVFFKCFNYESPKYYLTKKHNVNGNQCDFKCT